MRDLLFLAHRIPYPPNKGDKIRSWHMLRHFAERYRVHLGCFVDDPYDWRYRDALRSVCAECCFVPLRRPIARLRGLRALFDGGAITVRTYHSPVLKRWVDGLLDCHNSLHIFAYSSAMAQFTMNARAAEHRRVIDFVDVDSEKWRQYGTAKPWPTRWIYRREGARLLAFERAVAARFDAGLLVSAAEAALFRELAPESSDKIHAIENGVDVDFFAPERVYAHPFDGEREVLVFTGAMDYWPNVDAVVWFADSVFAALRAQRPGLRFVVVGANPAPAVAALDRRPGITVTGRVADVRPYLAHAAVVVAPLRVARGIQNKVLEAMAMARPIVATPEALAGLRAEPGRELAVAVDAEAFATATAALLVDAGAAEMGARARRRVVADYGWSQALAPLDSLVSGVAGERRRERFSQAL